MCKGFSRTCLKPGLKSVGPLSPCHVPCWSCGGASLPAGVRALSEGSRGAVPTLWCSCLIRWQTWALSSVYSLNVSSFRAVGLNTVPRQCSSPYVTRGQEPGVCPWTRTSCMIMESIVPIKRLYQPLCPLINVLSTWFWPAVLQILFFIKFFKTYVSWKNLPQAEESLKIARNRFYFYRRNVFQSTEWWINKHR